MILFFTVAIVLLAVIVLVNLFAPHRLPWYRPHLLLNTKSEMVRQPIRQPVISEGLGVPEHVDSPQDIKAIEKVGRLESILLEKNTLIEKLQKQLAAEKAHRAEFEKVQALLEEEIQSLRKQNKEIKIKTGET